jgi:tryprostatin B 6-hydroxylase
MDPHPGLVAIASAALGVVLHLVWFIHGEHLIYAPRYFVTALFGPGLLATALWYYLDFTPLWAILNVSAGFVGFYTGLFSSIVIYRVYFHPLRNFPGPPTAKLAQFDHVRNVAGKCNGFKYLDALHQQYGDFVRVGPNLLSIADPDWVEPIHNARSKWEKSDWYDGGYPMKTLHQMRDKSMHDKRRRHGWDQAFTTKSLRAYDGRLVKYADTLVDQIRKRSGKAVNGTSWTNYFAYDVMGKNLPILACCWGRTLS